MVAVRRYLLVLLVVCSTTLPLTATGGAVSDDTAADDCVNPRKYVQFQHGISVPAENASVNGTITRVNNSAIKISYHDIDSDDKGFTPTIQPQAYKSGLRIASAGGFRVIRDATSTYTEWDGSTKNPYVILRIASTSGGSAESAIQADWAFFPLPYHGRNVNLTLGDEPGFIGDQLALLGNHSRYQRAVGCHDIFIIIPDHVTPAESPIEIIDTIESTAMHLEVGWKFERVYLFGVSSPMRSGGRAYNHEAWVNVNTNFELDPHRRETSSHPRKAYVNTWVHEYVHTRQRWVSETSGSKDAWWLTEALASYFAISETERQGHIDKRNETAYWSYLNRSLRTGPEFVLTNASSFNPYDARYTKGAYVLAALDSQIQRETGGVYSVIDVFRVLNQQSGVDHVRFRSAVISVGGNEFGPWVDQYVASGAVPPAPPKSNEVYLELLMQNREYQMMGVMAGIVILFGIVTAWKLIKQH